MDLKIPPVAVVGILVGATALLLVGAALVLAARRSLREPAGLGLQGGKLRPCPASPNCVSSEEGTDVAHRVEPLPAGTSLEATRTALRTALAAASARAVVVIDEPGYLRATFRTPLIGFIDDVELRISEATGEAAGVVHVRSASRVGHSDLGANRARVERLRQEMRTALGASPAPR